MFFKSMLNYVTTFYEKNKLIGLYSQDQINALREVQDLEEAYVPSTFSSSASSTFSPAASGVRFPERKAKNLDMPYFETLEKRLGIEEEEFFKKEEFDIEE
jgi:hypothetical protein